MKRTKSFWRKRSIYLSLFISLFFSSCLKDEESTVLLPLPIGYIQGIDFPEGMLDQMQVNEGTHPPEIGGRFWAQPALVYASDNYWNDNYYDLFFAFDNIFGRLSTAYKEKQSTSQSASTLARVIGDGDNFTVYFTNEMKDPVEDWECTTATIISGTMAPQGISNFEYGTTLIKKRDPHNKLMPEGSYHIFKNSNPIALRQNW